MQKYHYFLSLYISQIFTLLDVYFHIKRFHLQSAGVESGEGIEDVGTQARVDVLGHKTALARAVEGPVGEEADHPARGLADWKENFSM